MRSSWWRVTQPAKASTRHRAGLIGARLETLIAGEREFMQERNITLPSAQTATSIADSEMSDED